jgi:transcription elongation GreA/GreB family factor
MRSAFPLRQSKTGVAAFTKVFPVQKSALRDAILRQLRQELATQTRAAEMAREEAISEESRPENKWDTHSQEAAYLAGSQAKLAAEIGESLELLANMPLPNFGPDDPVALGALVRLAPLPGQRGRPALYFVAPRAGGIEVTLDGETVLVVTPASPVGRQLLGRRVGELVTPPARPATAQQIAAVS